ncbi:MAG: NUDIX domain-containing protein [Elusimicrobia bacterium]|jgi:8-oxo-dGTP pyrophosphatase MutT (NUDIX family)|nr:NUDIX domain-containing protein [Elusimicrobiota bacterium]
MEKSKASAKERIVTKTKLRNMQEEEYIKKEFEFSAGGIVCHSGKVLLINSHPREADESFWTFPKGKIELEETVKEAALREVREETGCIGSIENKISDTRYIFKRGESIVIKKVSWFKMSAAQYESTITDKPVKVEWKDKNKALQLLKYRADRMLLLKQEATL